MTYRPSWRRHHGHRLIVGLLLLAGCAAAPADQVRVPSDPLLPALEWETALRGNLVEIVLVDAKSFYRVDQIDLRGPNAQILPATDITRRVIKDESRRPGMRFGVAGGSGGGGVQTGIGFSFPLGNRAPPSYIRTEAGIDLPDPDSYRATADEWTIRITLSGQAGEQSTADIPAPVE